ncbi:hypothetical protein SAMN02745190_00842 [Schwartzia succinivorans DSM 10502]|jgi:transcriptional regulator with XRE-family HTH domain|uniref:Cro/C1-type HTH DNA-binding domain-containing protein n=2 Tax=Schwartzia TaxID=55506 RepID=A0A1M4V0K3_9FIRM|nr:hypothetical protein SAMN02745190_00842 [Schwartzia succinivorans DSM 10502]
MHVEKTATWGGECMTNTVELEIAIIRAGLRKKQVAEALGITKEGLRLKMNNKTEFTASEIATLYKLLNLNFESQQKIFFTQSVE